MIVDIDGQRFNLAELPADVKKAKALIHQCVFRADADWYGLVGGGDVLVNWRAARFVRVVECPNPVELPYLDGRPSDWACACTPGQGGPHDLS